jgi:hypothetical protein
VTRTNIVKVDFARGEALPVGCDRRFYERLLDALTHTLARLSEQVPEGRELEEVGTVICEDNTTLLTYGYYDGSYYMADCAAGIDGIQYDRGNPLTHPQTIDSALRWLASKQAKLN